MILPLVILILSIILHEVSHGYAANSLGDPTPRLAGRLTLNPVPHLDFVGSIAIPAFLILTGSPMFFGWAKPVPYNPYNLRNHRWGETLVAFAGIATNLFIALIFGLLVRFGGSIGLSAPEIAVAATITSINLFLGLFNMIPFPPLDGFTVLRSALPWHISGGFGRFENVIRMAGVASLILFLVIFSSYLSEPFLSLVTWVFGLLTGTAL